MMKLLSSPASPFGRKVKVVARMKGVLDQIEIEKADTNVAENKVLKKENPLAKIPVLILADGTQLFDSHVICEYLDSLTPSPRLFPAAGAERFNTLTLGALGDGILEAALLLVYEKRFRPEDKWVRSWMDRQQSKIDTRARSPGGQSAAVGRLARLRPRHDCLRAGLSRLPARGQMASQSPAAGGLARPVRRSRPGLRGDEADRLSASKA